MSRAPNTARTEALRMLALLRERLDEAHAAGESALRLEPRDPGSIGSEAGLDADAVGVFRTLVRSNAVRLRERWREDVFGVSAPCTSPASPDKGAGPGIRARRRREAWTTESAIREEVGRERRR